MTTRDGDAVLGLLLLIALAAIVYGASLLAGLGGVLVASGLILAYGVLKAP